MALVSFFAGPDATTGPALVAVVIVLLCIFWVYQFVQLMLLSEVDFPGKYDKGLWVAAFIFAFVFTPFAFFGWKYAYRAMLGDQARSAAPKA